MCAVVPLQAFTLLGPLEGWQTTALGYDTRPERIDVGLGPMNLGEEYRWNLREITYAFDSSFLNYFGQTGVDAVEAAFQEISVIPSYSSLSTDLSEYPLETQRVNHRANALGLMDLKSYLMTIILEQIGLGAPERFTFTLRARAVVQNTTNYLVINRNYDPITFEPSKFVNGTLYTYRIQEFTNPNFTDAIEQLVDPLATSFTSVAGGSSAVTSSLLVGGFYNGLTRDDVAGLRYLYRKSNYNVESMLGQGANTASGRLSSPYLATSGVSNTNLLSPTNTILNSPFLPIAGTNTTVTNAATTNTITIPFIDPALRPGMDRVTFRRVDYDSLVGQNLDPEVISFTDTVILNGEETEQGVTRVVTQPEILITAEDLGVGGNSVAPIIALRTGPGSNATWTDNSGLNGNGNLSGPGVIQSPVTISVSKLGGGLINTFPFSLDEVSGFPTLRWGSFDGTTNAPIVYPSGTSVADLEAQIAR